MSEQEKTDQSFAEQYATALIRDSVLMRQSLAPLLAALEQDFECEAEDSEHVGGGSDGPMALTFSMIRALRMVVFGTTDHSTQRSERLASERSAKEHIDKLQPSPDPAVSVEPRSPTARELLLDMAYTLEDYRRSGIAELVVTQERIDVLREAAELFAVRAASLRMREEEKDQEDHARCDHPRVNSIACPRDDVSASPIHRQEKR